MEMDSLFDQEAGHATAAASPDAPGVAAAKDVQVRIRELSEERRALVGTDGVAVRRAAAIKRHRRRLDQAPSAEREERLALRRSLTVIEFQRVPTT